MTPGQHTLVYNDQGSSDTLGVILHSDTGCACALEYLSQET